MLGSMMVGARPGPPDSMTRLGSAGRRQLCGKNRNQPHLLPHNDEVVVTLISLFDVSIIVDPDV